MKVHGLLAAAALLMSTLAPAQTAKHPGALKPLGMGQADGNTFVGLVSESRCGAKHRMTDKTATECVRACSRSGTSYVLLAGEKTYLLEGRPKELDLLAGQKVKVTGSLAGRVVHVQAVAVAQ